MSQQSDNHPVGFYSHPVGEPNDYTRKCDFCGQAPMTDCCPDMVAAVARWQERASRKNHWTRRLRLIRFDRNAWKLAAQTALSRATKAEKIVLLADRERIEWQKLNDMWDKGERGDKYGDQAEVAQMATDKLWKALEK